jgi:hypothetical protein
VTGSKLEGMRCAVECGDRDGFPEKESTTIASGDAS